MRKIGRSPESRLPFPTSVPIFTAAKTTFRAMHPDARNQSSCRAGLLHEIKHDGYRLLVQREGKRVRLFTRNGHDWTDRYPLVVEAALRNRRSSFVIDGEAVLLGVDVEDSCIPNLCPNLSPTRNEGGTVAG